MYSRYSRLADGETDPVEDLHELVQAVSVDTNHRFNALVRNPSAFFHSLACRLEPRL